MTLIAGTLKNYPNKVLVETGTYHGDGVQAALDAGYLRVHSIEVSESMAYDAWKRFKTNHAVDIVLGDSTKELWKLIAHMDHQMTFVLDSHFLSWSPDTKGREDELTKCPLVEELKILAKHHIKTHTIIIDDVRLFGMFGTDIESVKALLLEINPDYEITFIDGLIENDVVKAGEVMVAEVKE